MISVPGNNKEHNTAHINDRRHRFPLVSAGNENPSAGRLVSPCILSLLLTPWKKAADYLFREHFSLRQKCKQAGRMIPDKITSILCILVIFCIATDGFCLEADPSPQTDLISPAASEQTEKTDATLWQKIWGKKVKDAVLIGMWSIHLKGSGEYFGSGESNEQNKLIGMVYNGIGAGTFINSHNDRSWFIGIGREVYSRELAENTRFDVGYRLGPLYGYDDTLPNLFDFSIFAAGTLGLSWYNFGFDIMVIPVGVVAGGFRINF